MGRCFYVGAKSDRSLSLDRRRRWFTRRILLLTDIARQKDAASPSTVIQGWLRNRNTLEFLRIWETKHNRDFDKSQCDKLMEAVRKPSFTITVTQWISRTKAIGLIAKQGKTGGTFAHPDIALDFVMYLNPEIRADFIMGNLDKAARVDALKGFLTYGKIQADIQKKKLAQAREEQLREQKKHNNKTPEQQLIDDVTFYQSVCILREQREQELITQEEYERIKGISQKHYDSKLYID